MLKSLAEYLNNTKTVKGSSDTYTLPGVRDTGKKGK